MSRNIKVYLNIKRLATLFFSLTHVCLPKLNFDQFFNVSKRKGLRNSFCVMYKPKIKLIFERQKHEIKFGRKIMEESVYNYKCSIKFVFIKDSIMDHIL